MGDVGYGGCKQRIKGIDKCKERFCTVLEFLGETRIIKIITIIIIIRAGTSLASSWFSFS